MSFPNSSNGSFIETAFLNSKNESGSVYLPSINILYTSYPISWLITFFIHVICFLVLWHRLDKKKTKI